MVTKSEIMLVKLLADKRARAEHGLFVAEGRKMVMEAIASGMEVTKIYGTDEFSDIEKLEPASAKDIERMSSLKTPQGILALVKIPKYDLPQKPGEHLTLVLDGVQDPGNMGTIIRIADWFGINDIICSPDSADCYNPKVVQATMGAIFRVKVHYAPLADIIKRSYAKGIHVYGTFLEGDNIYKSDLGDGNKGLIVMGNEGNGISAEISSLITDKLYIPPYPAEEPSAESLNVATATAIVCSEFRRRAHK